MPSPKRVAAVVNIQLEAGQASMAKAGQALGPHGINPAEVVRSYNAATANQRGEIVPAVVTISTTGPSPWSPKPHRLRRCCGWQPDSRRAPSAPTAFRSPR
jgi:Ribosomal protein L11, N-terminal domain